MWPFLFALLSACSSVPAASATAVSSESDAPSNWFYADPGDTVDWETLRFRGSDAVFRTVREGLRAGPVAGASWLVCGEATRATLLFEAGALVEVFTVPAEPCVEAAARALSFVGLDLDGVPLEAAERALVVYDVPAEASCSSCS